MSAPLQRPHAPIHICSVPMVLVQQLLQLLLPVMLVLLGIVAQRQLHQAVAVGAAVQRLHVQARRITLQRGEVAPGCDLSRLCRCMVMCTFVCVRVRACAHVHEHMCVRSICAHGRLPSGAGMHACTCLHHARASQSTNPHSDDKGCGHAGHVLAHKVMGILEHTSSPAVLRLAH